MTATLLPQTPSPTRRIPSPARAIAARLPTAEGRSTPLAAPPDPADAPLRWAESGAMALTGSADGAPRSLGPDLAGRAEDAIRSLAALAPSRARRALEGIDAGALLGERAACLGLRRRGSVTAGGKGRLLRASDGWLAVSLPRADDWSLVPAWTDERCSSAERWESLTQAIRTRPAAVWIERGRLLGLAVAPANAEASSPDPPAEWCAVHRFGSPARADSSPPRVIDLSSLWAGPLCAQLLGVCGADVIKVESTRRPDGARAGDPRFFDLMNAGKRSVALDFECREDRAHLRNLVASADIVIESSRPRALFQLGIDAEHFVRERPGRTWLAITGYGRTEPAAHWIAFGDDAAAAAGLARDVGGPAAPPIFCGDAIADPLAGVHGALAAQACYLAGGGRLIDLSLVSVARHARTSGDRGGGATARRDPSSPDAWWIEHRGERIPVSAPRARTPRDRAAALGANTAAVLAELPPRC